MTHILVVEDDPAAAQMLSLILQRAGYELSVVGTGAEALHSAQQSIQLVVLDLGLPDIDGLEVCRSLRVIRPGLPILVVSGRSSEADVVIALDAGADDYLLKPFRTQEFLARVRALLRRTVSSDLLFAGDISIDAASMRALVKGAVLPLTRKEYEILALLVRNAGSVVTREQLTNALWSNGLKEHSKSLDMHVSSTRRKLEDAGCDHPIRTVRGVGFAIQA